MKIIYFSLDYTPHDHRFLSALSETEHQVYYLRLQRGPRQTEDRIIPANIEQIQWSGGKDVFRWRDVPKYVVELRQIIKRIKPDLVHAGPIQTCAFIAVLSGFRPILTMSWGFDLMKDVHRSKWWEHVTRYTLKRSTFFTSDAIVTRDKAVFYGMNSERTVVFPWGVDLEHFKPTADDRPQTGDTPYPAPRTSHDDFTLFCNRSWEPNYGVDVLARAFVRVAQSKPEVNLMLLGGGSQGAAIRNILANGGAIDRVIFPGHINNRELPRFYNMADLYITPSHVDGSSVSLMEALACGMPCIASDIPSNLEWVTDGVNGWIFPDGDADGLAKTILKAMAQPERLPEISKNARKTAEEKANWKENFAKLLQAYEMTIKLENRRQL